MTCVACGDEHADPDTATRIGISFVAVECAWTLRYPGMSASEVIESLEVQLKGHARASSRPPPEVDADGVIVTAEQWEDPDKTTVMEPVSDDPAERSGGQFAEDILCPVCDGDGELTGPDGETDGGAVMCGRCNGSGRVLVSAT